MSIEEKLNKILEKHRHDYWDYCKNLIDSTEFEKREDKAKHQILELIKEARIDELEKIPKEPNYGDEGKATEYVEERLNQLSQQTLDN